MTAEHLHCCGLIAATIPSLDWIVTVLLTLHSHDPGTDPYAEHDTDPETSTLPHAQGRTEPHTLDGLQQVPPAHLSPDAQHLPLQYCAVRQQLPAVVHFVPAAQHFFPQICSHTRT